LLTQEIATLRALRTSVGGGAQVIESAVASATPAVPNTRRAVEIGFVIALLLGIGAVFVAENGDRRLRTPEALERLTNMPLLGTIARSAFSPNRRRSGRDDDAFQMLRASLTYLNVDRSLPSIAIVSPGPEDGKTTVAVGLAIATARAGRRAVLVDADLRRPGVCARLGITATSGLAAVLAKESQLSEVLVEHPVDAPEGGHLLVLPAGDPPPNPSALLGSQEMRTLLGKLEAQADLVIVDTPAALAVGDALPLLHNVSGVMMIVRMNQSSRVAVERLQQVISSAGSAVIGVVATACRAADGYEDYGYYAGTRKRRGLRSALRLRRRRPSTPTPAVTTNASAASAPPSAAQPE
jgi:capsular exopolysaccharide synthesis family protein